MAKRPRKWSIGWRDMQAFAAASASLVNASSSKCPFVVCRRRARKALEEWLGMISGDSSGVSAAKDSAGVNFNFLNLPLLVCDASG